MKLSFLTAPIIFFTTSAWAQPNPWFYQPLAQLKDFLQLSDSQLQTILDNNDQFNGYAATKQSRIAQVQTEIAAETAKETLDPMALGIRYAEIESICRELKDQAVTYQQKNTVALSDPQRAKLQILQDAMKLAPVISEGISGNLIGTFTNAPAFFAGASGGSFTALGSAGGIGYAFGCYSYAPFPGNIIPAGRPSVQGTPATDGKGASSSGGGVFRVGGGVTRPVRLYQVGPPSSVVPAKPQLQP